MSNETCTPASDNKKEKDSLQGLVELQDSAGRRVQFDARDVLYVEMHPIMECSWEAGNWEGKTPQEQSCLILVQFREEHSFYLKYQDKGEGEMAFREIANARKLSL